MDKRFKNIQKLIVYSVTNFQIDTLADASVTYFNFVLQQRYNVSVLYIGHFVNRLFDSQCLIRDTKP